MSQAPLPPHERTWRHPSELAAAEREAARTAAPPHGSRAFAMAGGTVGLLVVCLLVMTLTPDQQDAPVAVSATTTPLDGVGAQRVLSGVAAIGRYASEVEGGAAVLLDPALATPIGDGRSALMTPGAALRTGERFDVRLTSGAVVEASVIDTTESGLVVVTIASSDMAHDIADEPPEPDDIVTVLGETTVTVPFDEVDDLDLAEGTAVLDDAGALVGLCTRSGGLASVLDATGHGDDAPTSSAPGTSAPPSTAETTEPSTTITVAPVNPEEDDVATTTAAP